MATTYTHTAEWIRCPEHDSAPAGFGLISWAWRDAKAGCLVLRFTSPGETPAA